MSSNAVRGLLHEREELEVTPRNPVSKESLPRNKQCQALTTNYTGGRRSLNLRDNWKGWDEHPHVHEKSVVEVDPERQLLLVGHCGGIDFQQAFDEEPKSSETVRDVFELVFPDGQPWNLVGLPVGADVRPGELTHGFVRVGKGVAAHDVAILPGIEVRAASAGGEGRIRLGRQRRRSGEAASVGGW